MDWDAIFFVHLTLWKQAAAATMTQTFKTLPAKQHDENTVMKQNHSVVFLLHSNKSW